jgi:hypothetical protein
MIGFRRGVIYAGVRSFVLGLAVLGAGAEVGAAPVYLATARVDCYTDSTITSGPVPAQSETCAAFSATASADVDSDVGVIRAHATAAFDSGTLTSARGQSVARFQDSFSVTALDSGSVSVPNGLLTVTVDVDTPVTLPAIQGPSNTHFGSILWNYSVGSGANNGRTLLNEGSGNTGGRFAFEIPWTAGTPIDILFFANLEVQLTGLGAPSGTGNFTIAWAGITAVTDGVGVPVQSFTALSSEGFDYALDTTAAAPVPAIATTGRIMLVALIGIAAAVSARRLRSL